LLAGEKGESLYCLSDGGGRSSSPPGLSQKKEKGRPLYSRQEGRKEIPDPVRARGILISSSSSGTYRREEKKGRTSIERPPKARDRRAKGVLRDRDGRKKKGIHRPPAEGGE